MINVGLLKPRASEDRIVLDNVSEQIRECLEAAENCARNVVRRSKQHRYYGK